MSVKEGDEVVDATGALLPGGLDDGAKTVPLVALELLQRSTTDTANTIEWLRKQETEKSAKLQEQLNRALSGVEDVKTLHEMLHDPFYARRLIDLLYAARDIEALFERRDEAPDSDRCGSCGSYGERDGDCGRCGGGG